MSSSGKWPSTLSILGCSESLCNGGKIYTTTLSRADPRNDERISILLESNLYLMNGRTSCFTTNGSTDGQTDASIEDSYATVMVVRAQIVIFRNANEQTG